MAINAYTSGTNTNLQTTNVYVKSDVQHGDMLYWNSEFNFFETDRGVTLPNLSGYATQAWVTQQLVGLGGGGGEVDLSLYPLRTDLHSVAFSGNYLELINTPIIPTDVSQLTDNTNLFFSRNYNDLINAPVLFSGDYNDLTNKPNLGSYTQTLNLSGSTLTITDGNSIDLSALQDGVGIGLTDLTVTQLPAQGGGALIYDNQSGVFTYTPPNLSNFLTSVSWTDITNKPTTITGFGITDAFDGRYASLTDKPNIPNDLLDLNISDGSAGQVLHTNGMGNFYFADVTGGSSNSGIALTNLSVTTNPASGGGSLSYDNTTGIFRFRPANLAGYATTSYVSTQIGALNIPTSLFDLGILDGSNGQVLTTDGSGNLTFSTVNGGSGGVTSYTQLTDLPDLTVYQLTANAFDGNYNSLTNKPTIPTDISDLTDTTNLLGSGGGAGIALTDLSVTQNSASGSGTLAYNSTTGVFTYTPPVLFDGQYSSLTGTPSIPSNLTDLGITDGTNGQVLTTDGSGNYTFTTISSGTSNATTLNNYSASYYLDYNNFTNTPTIPQNLGDLADVDGTATPSTGQVLKWDGTQWAPASDLSSSSGSGIALTDLSVTQNTASGTGALTYDNTTGTFDYTPPDLSNLGGGTGEHIQWTTSGTNNELRISEQWLETGSTYTVRSVGINDDGLLQVELATFSPTVSATGQSLYWDEPATQFSVSVDNPTDFTSRYIDSVYSITGATGVSTTLSDYTAGTKSATPAGGVDWTQTFTAQTSSSSSGGGLNLTMVGYNNDGANSSATWMFADAASATNFKNIIDGMPMPTGTAGGIVYFYDADGYFYRHGANQSSWDTRNFVANIDSSNSNWVNITWSGSGTDMFYQTTNPNGIGSGVELIQVAMIYVTAGQPGHTTNPYEVGDTISGSTWGTNPGVFGTGTGSSSTTSSIVSNGTGLTGGTAGATINFADDQGAQWADSDTISYTWQNVDSTISFATLSGQNFLGKYTTVDYTIGITGLSDTNNATVTVGGTGGTLSNTSGDGTLTFADALHKDNNTGRDVDVSVEFSRPAGVTGTAYTVTDTDSDTNINASFTYPSFYYWTSDVNTVPTRADIVDGNDFDATVTELGNQAKSIQTTITNSGSQAQAFWFAVRSSATQPTVFQTGPSSALLSDVNVTTGNTVDLEPDAPEAGYVAEEYTLYGITLQPGDTYMRIN